MAGRHPKPYLKRYGNYNLYVDLPPVGGVTLSDAEMYRLGAYARLEGVSRASYVTRIMRKTLEELDRQYRSRGIEITYPPKN